MSPIKRITGVADIIPSPHRRRVVARSTQSEDVTVGITSSIAPIRARHATRKPEITGE